MRWNEFAGRQMVEAVAKTSFWVKNRPWKGLRDKKPQILLEFSSSWCLRATIFDCRPVTSVLWSRKCDIWLMEHSNMKKLLRSPQMQTFDCENLIKLRGTWMNLSQLCWRKSGNGRKSFTSKCFQFIPFSSSLKSCCCGVESCSFRTKFQLLPGLEETSDFKFAQSQNVQLKKFSPSFGTFQDIREISLELHLNSLKLFFYQLCKLEDQLTLF